MDEFTFQPGPRPRTVRAPNGEVKAVPRGWELLPPGDAALTRRVKKAGETWSVKQKRGRRVFSQGVWAPQSTIKRIKVELEQERSTEQYQKKRQSDQRRRIKKQGE